MPINLDKNTVQEFHLRIKNRLRGSWGGGGGGQFQRQEGHGVLCQFLLGEQTVWKETTYKEHRCFIKLCSFDTFITFAAVMYSYDCTCHLCNCAYQNKAGNLVYNKKIWEVVSNLFISILINSLKVQNLFKNKDHRPLLYAVKCFCECVEKYISYGTFYICEYAQMIFVFFSVFFFAWSPSLKSRISVLSIKNFPSHSSVVPLSFCSQNKC